MKLIKKLLIPGVALSVLFGFSFADGSLSCGFNNKACSVVITDFLTPENDCYLYCNAGGSSSCSNYQFQCTHKISSIDLGKYGLFGINQKYYYIKNQNFSNNTAFQVLRGSNSVYLANGGSSIVNNNLIYNYTLNYTCGSYITGDLCNKYNCKSSVSSVSDCDNYTIKYTISSQSINYIDLPAINQNSSGEYFIGGAVNNKIGQGTSQGFSNLLHFIIQFLPLMIFVFIIGYIIRKVLIRFGMLKSPGVALNSKTYNKGKN